MEGLTNVDDDINDTSNIFFQIDTSPQIHEIILPKLYSVQEFKELVIKTFFGGSKKPKDYRVFIGYSFLDSNMSMYQATQLFPNTLFILINRESLMELIANQDHKRKREIQADFDSSESLDDKRAKENCL